MAEKWVTVMGSFVADLAFRTQQLPAWGQTVMGTEFRLGPGGKGSNQAVAAARLGGKISFISMLGRDAFGDLARETYKAEGIDTEFCFETVDFATGAASIVVHATKGENAIVVVPGACFQLTADDVDRAANPAVVGVRDPARAVAANRGARPRAGAPLPRADDSESRAGDRVARPLLPAVRLPHSE